jgi:hypothetical protein
MSMQKWQNEFNTNGRAICNTLMFVEIIIWHGRGICNIVIYYIKFFFFFFFFFFLGFNNFILTHTYKWWWNNYITFIWYTHIMFFLCVDECEDTLNS